MHKTDNDHGTGKQVFKLDIPRPEAEQRQAASLQSAEPSPDAQSSDIPLRSADVPPSSRRDEKKARKQAKTDAAREKRRAARQKDYDKALAKYRRRHKDKTEQECRDAVDAKMEKKRKRARRPVGSIMLMVFGALLLAFPIVSDLHASWLASQAITSYTSTIESMSAEEKDAMMAQALSYNHRLAGIATEEDIQAGQVPYEGILNTTGTGIMGSVTIDCIGVNQPIYHGTDESTLMSGVGHMEGTSFPMASGGTHAAIAGHTGMPGQRMFDELVDLEPGDVVKVRLLDTETWYAVSSSEVVDPTMTATFVPEAGVDELTLITCTPYGINDHRLLVHCEAIPPQDQDQSDFGIANEDKLSKYINLRTIPIIVTVLLAICGILWRITKKLRSRRKKRSLDKRTTTEANQASTSSRGTPE